MTVGRVTEDDPFVPNTVVNGRPARWTDASEKGVGGPGPQPDSHLFVPGEAWANLLVSDVELPGSGQHHFGQADAIAIASLVTVSDNLTDPSTWPVESVG